MHQSTKRSVLRTTHLIPSTTPILGHIYSPFGQIPNYVPATRMVFVPVMAVSTLWIWKGPVLRQLISKRLPSGTDPVILDRRITRLQVAG